MKMHPHNANPEAYEVAAARASDVLMDAKRLHDTAYLLTVSTIEATDARRDAIELNRAVEALRAAAEAVSRAARRARDNAADRADTLAKVEGRDA